MKLYIIRHGDPDYEHDTLTERGWQEAELLSERLMREKIDKIYLSPLGRAQATAKPYLEKTGMEGETLDFLREFPRGVVQPLREEGIGEEDRRSCPWDVDLRLFEKNAELLTDDARWSEHKMYDPDDVEAEVNKVKAGFDQIMEDNGLKRVGYHYELTGKYTKEELNDRTVAIFCHMGLGSLLLAHIAHIAPPHFWQEFRFMPTSVSTIFFVPAAGERYQSKIFAIGDTTHLTPIGLTYRW